MSETGGCAYAKEFTKYDYLYQLKYDKFLGHMHPQQLPPYVVSWKYIQGAKGLRLQFP